MKMALAARRAALRHVARCLAETSTAAVSPQTKSAGASPLLREF
jgi:hypothetical protein